METEEEEEEEMQDSHSCWSPSSALNTRWDSLGLIPLSLLILTKTSMLKIFKIFGISLGYFLLFLIENKEEKLVH